jgi:hypothetical protein
MKVAKRNKKIVKEVLLRDNKLCYCCGFKANEVHHIIPLVYGGDDNFENMVAICSKCHLNAPDTKEKFIEYAKKGGFTLPYLYGTAVIEYRSNESELKKVFSLEDYMKTIDHMVKIMRQFYFDTINEEKENIKRDLQNSNTVKEQNQK